MCSQQFLYFSGTKRKPVMRPNSICDNLTGEITPFQTRRVSWDFISYRYLKKTRRSNLKIPLEVINVVLFEY